MAFAIGLAQPAMAANNESVPARVTILQCGQGRMRGVRNYKNKCNTKKQRGIQRDRTSRILQREQPRLRASRESSETPHHKAETWLQKAHKMLAAKRAAK